MLHPLKSFLVVVDAPATSTNNSSLPFATLQVLTDAADLLSVPRFATRYPNTAFPGLIANALPNWIPTDEKRLEPAAVNWAATPLGRAIAMTGRSQMIVCGLWLEEAITMLTLKSLSLGIDTYIAVDATVAITPNHAAAAHARLTQAGAVPTTSEQVVREWGALTADIDLQTKLIALLGSNSTSSP